MFNSNFETVSHARLFPANIFTTQISRCDFHWHSDYELLLVLKGSVTAYSSNHPSVLRKGDLILFNSNTIHGVQCTGESNLCLCLQFSPEILSSETPGSGFFHYFYLKSPFEYVLNGTSGTEVAARMARVALLSQKKTEYTDLLTYSELLNFIVFLLQHVQYDLRRIPQERAETSEDELYEKITNYIRENLRSTELATDLCRSLGIGEKTVYRYLKSILGISLKELVDIIRVENACVMLRESQKPIPVIWDEIGYASEVSFYRNFKKQMGVTPNDYRKGASAAQTGYDHNSYSGFNLGEASALLERFAYPLLQMDGGLK